MTHVFGSTQYMNLMINLMKYPGKDIDIVFEFIAEDKIREPNSMMPIDEKNCEPISNYFDTINNIAVSQLIDDYLVLKTSGEHDGAALAQSNQRNVLCIQTNRIFYYNTTIKTISGTFTPNEDNLFAERVALIRTRQLAQDLTDTVRSIPILTLQTYLHKLKEAEKKMFKHR